MLLGGAGDDFLAGDSGRDLLTGADRILGNADDDILIAGTTDFDNLDAALALIMQEWTRTDAAFATRVGHLQTGGGLNTGYLLTDGTVHDDRAADVLTGESGNDWFLFNKDGDGGVKDKATDLSTFESQFATDIDWMNNGVQGGSAHALPRARPGVAACAQKSLGVWVPSRGRLPLLSDAIVPIIHVSFTVLLGACADSELVH